MAAGRRLRSSTWFEGLDKTGFMHRAVQRQLGLPDHEFHGKPIIGICNSWSDLNPCNASLRELADHVKRGVWEAGGVPLEFPAMSLGEDTLRPNAMLFRNLAAMEVEESIRGNPLDGVVLLVGCDKTTPALLMGAASADLPTIVVSAGPLLSGRFRGRPIGTSDAWRFAEELSAGLIDQAEFLEAERGINRSPGTCQTMGTASTMAALCEAMGVALPHNAGIPAVDVNRQVLAHLSGNRIVELVRADLPLSRFLTPTSFANAIRANAAIGGSTNAVIHLLALAGRAGVPLTLADWDRLGRDVPCIVNLKPSGAFLMEEFHDAGGFPVVLRTLIEAGLVDGTAPTVTGGTLAETCAIGAQLPPRRDPPARRPGPAPGRHRRPARQPRPRRCGHQAVRRHARPATPPRPCGRVREHRALPRPHRRPRCSTSTPPRSSSSRAAARAAIPACPNAATWACRPSCCARASPTWSASPTPA